MNITKREPIRSKKITQAARGQLCTYNGPTCNFNIETTVFCHVDSYIAGKGKGQKADDLFGFFGCVNCHSHYAEGHSLSELAMRAMIRTQRILVDMGIIEVK